MKLLTSSWFTPLPLQFIRVGVSRSVPRNIGRGFRRFRTLEPGLWLDAPPDEFCRRYEQQLAALEASQVVARILEIAGDRTPVLCCYEPPDPSAAWCHRSLISAWLHDELGLEVCEYGQGCGHGWE
jgi:hypothetical protein